MLTKIKALVNEKEVKEIDRVIKEIYDVDYANNNSVAYNLGFDTVANLNGRAYTNLVRIVDTLNDGDGQEAFPIFILKMVFDDHKVSILKKELETNRNRYITLLYL